MKNEASTETRLTSFRTGRGSAKTSCPKMRASPPSWSSSVESSRTSVDLPEPFWPRIASVSPRCMVNVTPSSAGTRRRCASRRIPEILTRVGFPADRRGEPMENLSRGMQQKVALARALLTSPVLLLLDEPTTGLDPRSKLEVQNFIREMRAVHDSTILLCTHDLDEAEALAGRVGILDRGRLLALEPADDLKARFDADTLEEAFFAATGRGFEDEEDELDAEERAVLA